MSGAVFFAGYSTNTGSTNTGYAGYFINTDTSSNQNWGEGTKLIVAAELGEKAVLGLHARYSDPGREPNDVRRWRIRNGGDLRWLCQRTAEHSSIIALMRP